jgi:hypothetical protein
MSFECSGRRSSVLHNERLKPYATYHARDFEEDEVCEKKKFGDISSID